MTTPSASSPCAGLARIERDAARSADLTIALLSFHVTKADGSSYDQSNDYLYAGIPDDPSLPLPDPTTKVTMYIGGNLIYGQEL